MLKALQYLILLILIGNGLQPYLIDRGLIDGPVVELSDNSECHSEESDEQEEETTKDFVETNDSKVLEPKPNDFELNSGIGTNDSSQDTYAVTPVALDWAIDKHLQYSKIDASLRQHVHFSKRAIDDQA